MNTRPRERLQKARAAARGDATDVERYIDTHVYSPTSHEDYLETVGIRRIAALLT